MGLNRSGGLIGPLRSAAPELFEEREQSLCRTLGRGPEDQAVGPQAFLVTAGRRRNVQRGERAPAGATEARALLDVALHPAPPALAAGAPVEEHAIAGPQVLFVVLPHLGL